MKTRAWVRLVSFTAAALAVSVGFTFQYKTEAENNARLLRYSRERAMDNLTDSLTTIASTLEKERYSVSPALRVSMAAQIWREAGSAAAALGELPHNDSTLDKSSRFIAQAGDYAFYLAKKAASGQEITEEESKTIEELGRIARDYSAELAILEARFAGEALEAQTETLPEGSVSESLSKLEEDFPDYAALIYDGPLSDHIDRAEPAWLQDKEAVTQEEARGIAAEFMGIAVDRLESAGESEGKLPCYSFSAQADGRHWYCDVSRQGGIVTDWIESRGDIAAELPVEEAVRRAEKYLLDRGILNMEKTYYLDEDGIVLVNFAAVQDGVILYPDLIKVGVARDTGDVVRYEAHGYIMCHKPRELPTAAVTAEQASQTLDGGLTIESHRLALIPTDGQQERLCYEFLCRDPEGTGLLIYSDVQTGEEIQVLVLVENENGTLTV